MIKTGWNETGRNEPGRSETGGLLWDSRGWGVSFTADYNAMVTIKSREICRMAGKGAVLARLEHETRIGKPLNGIYFQPFRGSKRFLHRPAAVRQDLQG